MTNVKIFEKNSKIIGYEFSGHTGFSDYGSDIICASISVIACTCHLGLVKVLNMKVKHKMRENDGYFYLKLLKDVDNENAQTLLKTLAFSLAELAEQYSDFVKLEIIGG